jgi:hypothetical protein
LAIKAGCDIVEYRTLKAANLAYLATLESIDKGLLDPVLVMESVERSRALKRATLVDLDPINPENVPLSLSSDLNQEIVKKIPTL